MTKIGRKIETVDELEKPVIIPVDAYTSEEYARAERDRLWRKVWQQVGRVEEIPEVGNILTYDIHDDSIIVVRAAPDRIRAFHNVCPHRGRRLVDTPEGAKNTRGRRNQFICNYHGWRFNLDGETPMFPSRKTGRAYSTASAAVLPA